MSRTLENAPDRSTHTERHFLLDGKVALHQTMGGGHRVGLDAVFLAASVEPSRIKNRSGALRLVDLGAGVGAAGLCVAARHPSLSVTLVENHLPTLDLARASLADPANAAFANRVRLLAADVTLRGAARSAAGLASNMADWVIMNPPFWMPDTVRLSPNTDRQAAHILSGEGLLPWVRTAATLLEGAGMLSVIFPAEKLDYLLDALKGRFGGLRIFPLYKGEHEEARRVLVTAVKASRAPLSLLRGLVLHEPANEAGSRREWTPQANAVLKGEKSLFI